MALVKARIINFSNVFPTKGFKHHHLIFQELYFELQGRRHAI